MTAHKQRLSLAESRRQIYAYTAPAGSSPEELAVPAYWGNVLAKLQPGDRVEATEESGGWYCEYIVLSATDTGAQLQPLKGALLMGLAPRGKFNRDEDGLMVRHLGAHALWAVVQADGSVLKGGFETEQAAYQWLHTRRRAAA